MAIKKDKSKLTEIEKFCLDAYLINKNVDLCYILSRKREPTATSENIHRLALLWLRSSHVKGYIADRQVLLNQASSNNMLGNKNRTKGELIEELNALASSTSDPKTRTDILLKLADMAGMKKDEVKDEDNTVHYYLPLSCYQCELYVAHQKKNKEIITRERGNR